MRPRFYFYSVFAFLLLNTLGASAQEYKPRAFMGIHAAPVLYKRYKHNPPETINLRGTGFVTGISSQTDFSKRFSFHVELNYEQLLYAYVVKPHPDDAGHLALYHAIKTTNITAPISFKYHFIRGTRTCAFLNFGNYWTYKLSEESRDSHLTGEVSISNLKENHSLGLGFLAGLGMERSITERIKLTLELRDAFMLIDDTDLFLSTTNLTNNFNSVGLLFGIQFFLGKP